MAVIGPGSVVEDQIRPDPTLQNATQFEVVKIHNPLSDDFAVQVAQSVPTSLQYSIKNTEGQKNLSESQIQQTYGVNLRGPDQDKVSRKHVHNTTVIKSGQSLNFRGDVAQVAVRQLVNEIMQQRDLTKFLADPVQRNIIEREIILARGTMEDLMNNNLQSVTQQIDTALEKSNEEEQSFPGLTGIQSTTGASPVETVSGSDQETVAERKGPGRPRKS